MAIGLGRSPRATGAALQRGEATAYRFETIDLVQTSPTGTPMELIEGVLGRPLASTRSTLESAKNDLIDHIVNNVWPGEEALGAMGTYEPATDRYEPIIASPLEQALLAFALGRAVQDLRIDDARRIAAVDAAQQMLDVLALQDVEEPDEDLAAAVVLACSVLNDAKMDDGHQPMLDASMRRLMEMDNPAAVDDGSTTDAHAIAMSAYALAVSGEEDAARQLADRAWNALPVEQHSTLLPWIVWCELELENEAEPDRQQKLLQVRTMLHQRQVPRGDLRFGPSLSGGYVLGRTPRDVTAQSLRPGAALPAMLASSELTPGDSRRDEGIRLKRLSEFLLRLQISDDHSSIHRNPDRSTGGIRLAMWDSRMPPAAQAMALLTLQELLALSKDPLPDPADPDLY